MGGERVQLVVKTPMIKPRGERADGEESSVSRSPSRPSSVVDQNKPSSMQPPKVQVKVDKADKHLFDEIEQDADGYWSIPVEVEWAPVFRPGSEVHIQPFADPNENHIGHNINGRVVQKHPHAIEWAGGTGRNQIMRVSPSKDGPWFDLP